MENINAIFCNDGFNCAETTMRLLLDEYGFDGPDVLVNCMSGFGGGMQRNLVCGAVVAAVTALGLYLGRSEPDQDRTPSATAVKVFLQEFEQRHGHIMCGRLRSGYVNKSPEMYAHCSKYVLDAAALADEIIRRQASYFEK